VCHDRNAAVDDEAGRFGHMLATLKLHRAGAGFSHQPGGVVERLSGAFLVAAEV